MRPGLFPEDDMKTAASLQNTDYHSRMSRYYLPHGEEKVLRLIR